MNVDLILSTFNENHADCILIGPMRQTPSGVAFRSLHDELMIRCQLALPENLRKLDRLRALAYDIRW